MKQPLLSIILPAYQEAAGIRRALDAIRKAAESTGTGYEIIVIDDGSTDGTWRVLAELAADMPVLRALRLSRNFGKEYALCAGLEAASGKAVLIMDADLQHPPDLIPEMVRLWRDEGYEIVEGVKRDRGLEPRTSKWSARLFYWLMGKVSGYRLEGASDYRLLDRKVVEAWKQMPERNVFFRGMSTWLGFRRTSIPFDVAERHAGESSWTRLKLLSLAVTGLISFSSLPLRLVTLLGLVFLIAAVLLGLQTLYVKFSGAAVSGFTTVILLQLMIGSVVMVSLGIIGEYIGRIYDEIKGRPRYVITERVGWDEGRARRTGQGKRA